MSKFLKIAVAAAAVFSLQSQAATVIDNFQSDKNWTISDTTLGGGGVWHSSSTGLAGILGGQRDVFVRRLPRLAVRVDLLGEGADAGGEHGGEAGVVGGEWKGFETASVVVDRVVPDSQPPARRESPFDVRGAGQHAKHRSVPVIEDRPRHLPLQHHQLMTQRQNLRIATIAARQQHAEHDYKPRENRASPGEPIACVHGEPRSCAVYR